MKRELDRELVIAAFRARVLCALDEAARNTFDPPRNDAGACDGDLPRLFRAIDKQVEILAERYHVALKGEEVA